MPGHITLRAPLLPAALSVVAVMTLVAAAPAAPGPAEAARTAPTRRPPADPTPTPTCKPGENWTAWGGCRPMRPACPDDTIDEGGECVGVTPISGPTCVLEGDGVSLDGSGRVFCRLVGEAGDWLANPARVSVALSGAAGCIDVIRQPYPRAIVGEPTTYRLDRDGDGRPTILDIGAGGPGGYRLTGDGHGTLSPRDTTIHLDSGFGYRYPTIRGARLNLVLRPMTGIPPVWDGDLNPVRIVDWSTARIDFIRSSISRSTNYNPLLGPDLRGRNTLPAYEVAVATTWTAYLTGSYDVYAIRGHEYRFQYTQPLGEVPVGGRFLSTRSWDARQASAPGFTCDAARSRIYTPVIEAQSVLRP